MATLVPYFRACLGTPVLPLRFRIMSDVTIFAPVAASQASAIAPTVSTGGTAFMGVAASEAPGAAVPETGYHGPGDHSLWFGEGVPDRPMFTPGGSHHGQDWAALGLEYAVIVVA